MLKTLLKLERSFSISRHQEAPLLHEREPFWNTCASKGRALRRCVASHGNC